MMHKAWCSTEEVPYHFSRSSIKFHSHTGWKINYLTPILVRLLGQSQLSNPSDLPCCGMIHLLTLFNLNLTHHIFWKLFSTWNIVLSVWDTFFLVWEGKKLEKHLKPILSHFEWEKHVFDRMIPTLQDVWSWWGTSMKSYFAEEVFSWFFSVGASI